MSHVRIIPRLDIKGSNVVKPVHTEALRVVGQPAEMAARYYNEGADELIYLDIVASLYQRNLDFELLKSVSEKIFVPLTVGGGIRSIHDITNALRAGADKVAINTYAVQHPEFLSEAVKIFGSQCIVLYVEAKRVVPGKWQAYTDGGRERSGVDAIEWIRQALGCGIGEVLITSIDHDGTKIGFELDLVKAVTSFSPVPVIVHGGAGSTESIRQVCTEGGADAVAVSSIFHYNETTIVKVKQELIRSHVSVRL